MFAKDRHFTSQEITEVAAQRSEPISNGGKKTIDAERVV